MSKKILFIRPCATIEDMMRIKNRSNYYMLPIGILSIIAYSKKYINDVNFEILDFSTLGYKNVNNVKMYGDICEKVKSYKPDLVAISILASATVNHAEPIARIVKQINQNIAVVLGGMGPSVMTQEEIQRELPNVDGLCYSEGEIPFLELLKFSDFYEGMELNTSFITHKKIKSGDFSPSAKLLMNLDEIPTLPIEMVDLKEYDNAVIPLNGKKSIIMHTVRGCPFSCNFCAAPEIGGKKLRFYSAERVLEDIKKYIKLYSYNQLTILDEQLLFNKERAKVLISGLSEMNILLSIPNGMNISLIDEEDKKMFEAIKMDRFVFAIESGSQRVLTDIMNKPVKLDQAKKILELMYTDRWETHSNFVIGMPGETEEDRQMTVEFIKESKIDWSVFFVALPIRGSELYKQAIKKNHLIVDEIGVERIKNEEIDPIVLDEKAYLYNLECNFVNNYAMRSGNYTKAKKRFDFIRTKYPNHAFSHYYYAMCCKELGELDNYKLGMDEYHKLLCKDNKWKSYAEIFNLITK